MQQKEKIIIIGAGPAGLTAAYELSLHNKYEIIVLESDAQVGGISKTVDYKGNKIDIGGHRFFSKSEWVLEWWQQFLPIYTNEDEIATTYHRQSKAFTISKHAGVDEPHMMLRPRKSRIYYQQKFFNYPLKLNINTIRNIGFRLSLKILADILLRRVNPIHEENLEDFYINRFGRKLYEMFFKEYTYKVWGRHCHEIGADWGRQRVKGLSVRTILRHYFISLFSPGKQFFLNKKVEQSLTEFFLYPQQGPGQLWEKVAQSCRERNVDIRLQHNVEGMTLANKQLTEVYIKNLTSSEQYILTPDHVISTMPVNQLVRGLEGIVPKAVFEIATHLEYRDFLIVGLLLDEMTFEHRYQKHFDDNWLYIQDGEVKVGRIQLFHNWSPYMVADKNKHWIGAEYFCNQGDHLWDMQDEDLITFATQELATIGLIDERRVLDGTVVRMPKAYPSYVGSYQDFEQVKDYLNTIENLFPIGRNGTHKYNNQDHSMLTAREAVNSILNGDFDKENIWNINTEQEYHEGASK